VQIVCAGKLKDRKMKKIVVITLASAGMLASASAQTDLFSTIQNWTGTGANEAAMEIDWNQGTPGDALVWGYRWDGTSTAEQMLDAIVAADPHLYATVGLTASGTELFGLGYDQDGDGNFPLSPALSFNSQHLAIIDSTQTDDSRIVVDAGDLYAEGWNVGYWNYMLSTDTRLAANYSDWDYSPYGISGITLSNGDVDGFAYTANFTAPPTIPGIPNPAPVPEPSTWAMLGLGSLGMIYFRRKS
jgi:hypothetical protein